MSTARLTQRTRLRFFATVVIAATAVISFTSLANLASHYGFGARSWVFPVCIDAVAALGMDVWLVSRTTNRIGRNLAFFAIACSVAGNFLDWLISQGSWQAGILGMVPPVMLAWVLLTLHRHNGANHAAEATASAPPQPAPTQRPAERRPAPRPSTPPAEQPAPTAKRAPRATGLDEQVVNGLVAAIASGQNPTKRSVMSDYAMGNNRALAHLQEAKTRAEQREAA